MNAPNQLDRLLITGAAGGLGRVLRQSLKPLAHQLRLSDVIAMNPAENAYEEIIQCDLADKSAVDQLVKGCDAIVHLGGVSVEKSFEAILQANICGTFHIYEAARRHQVKRVIFASSNHVMGFYKQSECIDHQALHRPDGYYGLSKAYGEDMARFYFDRYGIESVCIRIGSSFEKPRDARMLKTWLSFDDLTELIRCSLFTPNVGFHIVYGVSDNPQSFWNNTAASKTLGYRPKDSAQTYAQEIAQLPRPEADAPLLVYQGGNFCVQGPFDE